MRILTLNIRSRWDTPSDKDIEQDEALKAAQDTVALIQAQLGQKANKPQDEKKSELTEIVGINHCRADIREYLSSQEVNKEISKETGVNIELRGKYIAPGEESLDINEKPLYLFISADAAWKVEAARNKIIQIMERPPPPPASHTIKVYTGIPNPEHQFQIKGKIVGLKGAHLKHIVAATKAKVHLRGKGSNFIEENSMKEAEEELHLFISAHSEEQLENARKLAESLMDTVRKQYKDWKEEQEKKTNEMYNQSYNNYQGYGNYTPEQYAQYMQYYYYYYGYGGSGQVGQENQMYPVVNYLGQADSSVHNINQTQNVNPSPSLETKTSEPPPPPVDEGIPPPPEEPEPSTGEPNPPTEDEDTFKNLVPKRKRDTNDLLDAKKSKIT